MWDSFNPDRKCGSKIATTKYPLQNSNSQLRVENILVLWYNGCQLKKNNSDSIYDISIETKLLSFTVSKQLTLTISNFT